MLRYCNIDRLYLFLKGSAIMAMATTTSATTSTTANNKNPIQELARLTDGLITDRIKTAPYDQTFLGTIIAIKFNGKTDVTSADYNKYTVRFNTLERDFIINDGKFHVVGEKVYVHIPNNDLNKRYVETIYGGINTMSHPQKMVYDNDKDTITEYWTDDLYRTFIITVKDKGTETEEVTKLTFPDGSVMDLEGF